MPDRNASVSEDSWINTEQEPCHERIQRNTSHPGDSENAPDRTDPVAGREMARDGAARDFDQGAPLRCKIASLGTPA